MLPAGNALNSARSPCAKAPIKAPAGITDFDDITGGGLSRSRTIPLVDGPGSGKIIIVLQFLVHGAQHCKEPGMTGASPASDRRPN